VSGSRQEQHVICLAKRTKSCSGGVVVDRNIHTGMCQTGNLLSETEYDIYGNRYVLLEGGGIGRLLNISILGISRLCYAGIIILINAIFWNQQVGVI